MKFKTLTGMLAIMVSSLALAACSSLGLNSDGADSTAEDMTTRNKEIARNFYEDLWFSDNTDAYSIYVADTYVVHDIGDRKGVTEEAIQQKEIADRLHAMGEMTGRIDYQVSEGDKVATRWYISIEPNEDAKAMGMTPVTDVPIINVFRFNDDGKIVEFWNHRHDVDLPRPGGPPPGN